MLTTISRPWCITFMFMDYEFSEVYMSQMEVNQTGLAKLRGCSPRKINEIVNGKRSISPAFAITLESVLGTTAEMWVRMQAEHDLWQAGQKVT